MRMSCRQIGDARNLWSFDHALVDAGARQALTRGRRNAVQIGTNARLPGAPRNDATECID
jgi:hypothetical protein